MEYLVNTAIKLPVTSTGLATGQTNLNAVFLKDGATAVVAPTYTEIGGGLYTVNFTPTTTGKWTVFVGGKTYDVEVVSKTLQNALGEVFDQCLGSWVWNKATGLLTLYRGDGSTLATYNVTETADEASRERIS
jgi:hypothetical protein